LFFGTKRVQVNRSNNSNIDERADTGGFLFPGMFVSVTPFPVSTPTPRQLDESPKLADSKYFSGKVRGELQ
jgi:hypothetical protein